MNNLVVMNNHQAVTTSLKVAEVFEKNHRDVMEKIRNLTAENSAVKKMFVEDNYLNNRNQQQPMYYMNRDGFTLLAMGFTGSKAMEFKLKYIDAFNQMENQIKEAQFRLPTNFDEMTLMLSNVMEGQEKKIEEQGKKVDFLMDLSGLTSSRNKELTKARNKKVIQVCGGTESNSYKDKSLRSKIYKELFKSFRNRFDVSQYVDTPMRYFDKAKDFISNWYPPFELKEEIELRNAQENLF